MQFRMDDPEMDFGSTQGITIEDMRTSIRKVVPGFDRNDSYSGGEVNALYNVIKETPAFRKAEEQKNDSQFNLDDFDPMNC
jgi:hypothetical protein